MKEREESSAPSLLLAVITSAFAAAAIYASLHIDQPKKLRIGDIGLRAFPVGLSCVLLFGGVLEGLRWFLYARSPSKPKGKGNNSEGAIHVIVALLASIAYVALIPLVGFVVASMLFAASALVYLGTVWYWALFTSGALVGVIYALFVNVFHVQLPRGIFFG